VTGNGALIKNQVIFSLSGLPVGFDPMTRISRVQFQYGTTRCDVEGTVDRCVPEIPEPSTIILMGMGIIAHQVWMSRRRARA
jgi:hypothetical protein